MLQRVLPVLRFVLLALVVMLAPGCMPTSVTLNFGDPQARLRESTVATADAGGSGGAKIALIEVRGLIIDGPTPGLFTRGRSPVAELALRLRTAQDDPDVKGVVLRINSPGGGVGATETMYNEVRRFRERTGKPVVVHLGDLAASGGYYLALAGDRIIASPSGITGSIGVIIPTFNFSAGMQKVGIVSRSVKSRENKDLANPFEPMKDGQYAVLQSMVDGMYATFRERVCSRRSSADAHTPSREASMEALVAPLDMARLDELTDGRVMLGSEAVKAGLADEAGDLYAAFAHARKLARAPSAQLVVYYRGEEKPLTPYALSEYRPEATAGGQAGAPSAGTEINLLQVQMQSPLNLSDPLMSTGGAYYIWWSGM